jgi:hypothetical protein
LPHLILITESINDVLPWYCKVLGTFKPITHNQLITSLIESLAFRQISVLRDEYTVSEDGMKLFGLLELASGFEGSRFALDVRNANDKSMRLALTVGYLRSSASSRMLYR